MTRRNMVDYLPPEKAREDLDVFFTLLRTTYGAYEYFGGDEVFEKVSVLIPPPAVNSICCGVLSST